MPERHADEQPTLFALPDAPPPTIAPAPTVTSFAPLAAELPRTLRLGGMSWNYPGWRGSVFDAASPVKELGRRGLPAYAQHPLFRAVEIDRTAYEPLPESFFAELAREVPADFRFLVKAHDHLTTRVFPSHPRYGKLRGETNPAYFDARYAIDAVIGPTATGLGAKLGVLLFQCPPQDVGESPEAFADRLHAFLVQLPRLEGGPRYAVELRNRELFTARYAEALADAGVLHCHNLRPGVPTLATQLRLIPPTARRPLLIRWLLHPADRYEEAQARYEPYDQLAGEDRQTRTEIARMVVRASAHEVETLVLVDNKAEGSAPLGLVKLAELIAELCQSPSPSTQSPG